MNFIMHPWHLLVVALSSWINREQGEVIEYLRVENQVLREKLGNGRILLNDDQRRRLAVKGKVLGRKALANLDTLVTPDTLMRWHRQLVAEKWAYSDRRNSVGRPRTRQEIVDLILQMAKENSGWGYDRIQGALKNVGHCISDTTGQAISSRRMELIPRQNEERLGRRF